MSGVIAADNAPERPKRLTRSSSSIFEAAAAPTTVKRQKSPDVPSLKRDQERRGSNASLTAGEMYLAMDNVARKDSVSEAKEEAWRDLSSAHRYSFSHGSHGPWWDPTCAQDDWPTSRRLMAQVVFSPFLDHSMSAIVVFNLGLIVYQTDADAKCYPRDKDTTACLTSELWIVMANRVLLAIYILEAICKIFAARSRYFLKLENIVDLSITILGIASEIVSSMVPVAWMRVFRLWRLARVLNSLSGVSEIHLLLGGMSGAIKAMFFGAILLFLTLLFCCILIVQFVHPVNVDLVHHDCERCHRAYGSVGSAMLTLFQQVIAGDSWGDTNVLLIEHQPTVGLMTVAVQVFVSVGIMNLILAVVVDRAAEAREHTKEHLESVRQMEIEARKFDLLNVISEHDTDCSGTLSREEMAVLLQTPELQIILRASDVSPGEIELICESLQNGGDVKYAELVSVLHHIESADMRKLAVISHMTMAHEFSQQQEELNLQAESIERMIRIEVHNAEALARVEDKLAMLSQGRAVVPHLVPADGGPAGFVDAVVHKGCMPEPVAWTRRGEDTNNGLSPLNHSARGHTEEMDMQKFSNSLDSVERLMSGLLEHLAGKGSASDGDVKLGEDLNHNLRYLDMLRETVQQQDGALRQQIDAFQEQLRLLTQSEHRSFCDKCTLIAAQEDLVHHIYRLEGCRRMNPSLQGKLRECCSQMEQQGEVKETTTVILL